MLLVENFIRKLLMSNNNERQQYNVLSNRKYGLCASEINFVHDNIKFPVCFLPLPIIIYYGHQRLHAS